MDTSDEILKLVRTVAGLPREDQERMLRLVELLSLAPFPVQQRVHGMLRSLLDAEPESKLECAIGVDGLIDYLERAVHGDERAARWERLHSSLVRGTTQ